MMRYLIEIRINDMCNCQDVEIGSYDNQVEVPIPAHMTRYRIARRSAGLSETICIDRCILDEMTQLWAEGVITYGSCCGHNRLPPTVSVGYPFINYMIINGYEQFKNSDFTFMLKNN